MVYTMFAGLTESNHKKGEITMTTIKRLTKKEFFARQDALNAGFDDTLGIYGYHNNADYAMYCHQYDAYVKGTDDGWFLVAINKGGMYAHLYYSFAVDSYATDSFGCACVREDNIFVYAKNDRGAKQIAHNRKDVSRIIDPWGAVLMDGDYEFSTSNYAVGF